MQSENSNNLQIFSTNEHDNNSTRRPRNREKAKAYAENIPVTVATWGMRKSVIADAYLAGATEALASQWVSVEDRLPKPYENVLTYSVETIDENAVAYLDREDWYHNQ